MGWIRFIFAIPMILHAVVFFFANNYYSKLGDTSKKIKYINYLFYATYLLTYAFLPDGGDTSDSASAFFGLIRNGYLLDVSSVISSVAIQGNIVLLIIQTLYARRITKNKRKSSLEPTSENDTNNEEMKPWYKTVRIWLIIAISIIALYPYILWTRNAMFPGMVERQRYQNFPHIATITVSSLDTLTREEYIEARELIEARIDWVHNQKSDWDAHGRKRFYTLDLSQSDRIKVIFGYENDFDINAFVNEIVNLADLRFIDSEGNTVIYVDEIISARDVYNGATQSRDVILSITKEGKQDFLAFVDRVDENKNITIVFDGSIPSDYFTIEEYDGETIIIKGFVNSSAAQALTKLIAIKTEPANLHVELRID